MSMIVTESPTKLMSSARLQQDNDSFYLSQGRAKSSGKGYKRISLIPIPSLNLAKDREKRIFATMDSQTQQKIEETVLEILKSADMEKTTEFKIRSMAAERLGLDLAVPDRKLFVRQVVESFLQAKTQEEQQQQQLQPEQGGEEQQEEEIAEGEEEEEEDDDGKKKKRRMYDDEGNLIICNLNKRRRVTIQEFRGKMLVSIREYYEKDGKQLPSSKGISLTAEQWEAFSQAVPKIEEAIRNLEGGED